MNRMNRMNRMNKSRRSLNEAAIQKDMLVLISLCEKWQKIQNFERKMINEGSPSILMEELDQKDMATLNATMKKFQERIATTKKEIDFLKKNIVSNESDANAGITFLEGYIDRYDEALQSLIKSAANLDFTTGYWASGWAKNMTIPGLVGVATTAASRLTAFLTGYNKVKDKLSDLVEKKVKDDKLEKSLAQLAEENIEGMPGIDQIMKFTEGAFGEDVQPSWWKGKAMNAVKGLLAVTMPSTAGIFAAQAVKANQQAVKDAIAKFPDPQLKSKQIGEAIGKAFVNVKLSSLKKLPEPAPAPPVTGLQEPLKDATADKSQGLDAAAAAKGATSKGEVEVDGKTYVQSKKGSWYEKGAKNIGDAVKTLKKDPKLLKKVLKAAEELAKSGAKAEGEDEVEVNKKSYVKSKQGNWYEKGAKNVTAAVKALKDNPKLLSKVKDAAGEDEEDEVEPEDASDAADAAEKVAAKAKSNAKSTTMGKAIYKAVIDYVEPYYNRKSLSGKKKDALRKAVEDDLGSALDTAADRSGKAAVKSIRGALEKWFNSLDPSLQKNLGGAAGSKKVLQKAAQTVEDVITTNFKIEESLFVQVPTLSEVFEIQKEHQTQLRESHIIKPQENINKNEIEAEVIDRWQVMAGIK